MASKNLDIFDFIVITAPNEFIASEYRRQFQLLVTQLQIHSVIHCVADPLGKRIGSGGGTLNALDHLLFHHGKETIYNSRVAVIHSGGDSRRSPLHSVCGKAWASLNISSPSYLQESFMQPIVLAILDMISICQNCCPGTLIVSCSDVLLHLGDYDV